MTACTSKSQICFLETKFVVDVILRNRSKLNLYVGFKTYSGKQVRNNLFNMFKGKIHCNLHPINIFQNFFIGHVTQGHLRSAAKWLAQITKTNSRETFCLKMFF